MEIRPLDLADLDAAIDIRTRSFGPMPAESVAGWKKMVEADAAQYLAVYDGRRLVGLARYHRFRQYWLGGEVPMAGVGGVVVAPEERGRGVGRLLMTGMLSKIAGDGFALSMLYPATTPIYRQLGWEHAGTQPLVRIPTEALRTVPAPPVKLRRVGPDDLPEIMEMVRRLHLANRDCGPVLFPEHTWRHWMSKDPPFAYLADDGYLEYHWDGRETLFVEYAGALSEETTRAFWSLVGTSSSIARTVRANISPHDPIRWLTRENEVESEPSPSWMLRVVDAGGAVAGRGFPAGVSVSATLTIDDPQLPANTGPWRLEIGGGSGSLVPAAAGADPQVRLTAGGFAALYAGTPMSSLRRAGLATGGDPPADVLLDAAFTAQPYCLDTF